MGRRKGYRIPIRERLARHIDTSGGPDACWPWTGGRTIGKPGEPGYEKGYGMFIIIHEDGTREGRTAHSVVYEEYVGPIPEGHRVCHKCDNPPCCNPGPNHLFTGTAKDNTQDMVTKGRARGGPIRPLQGMYNPMAKLMDEEVIEILDPKNKDVPHIVFARRFKVSEGCIRMIRTGRGWGHLR